MKARNEVVAVIPGEYRKVVKIFWCMLLGCIAVAVLGALVILVIGPEEHVVAIVFMALVGSVALFCGLAFTVAMTARPPGMKDRMRQ